MKVLVTGGAGFIGSTLVRSLIKDSRFRVLNLDKLTYAGDLSSLDSISSHPNYKFLKTDITDAEKIRSNIVDFEPDIITHLAAESHVDRSIDGPDAFIQTNIVGTYVMLTEARSYFERLSGNAREAFRFHHISTDEVYGSLGQEGLFTEDTPYDPRSPYSASKASSDHLVSAWGHTFGLPVIITNCSNNYGPYQFPEKLIPLIIAQALSGNSLPVYGRGDQVRDWLYVEDHVRALQCIFERGTIGRKYNIGGGNERQNIEVVQTICLLLDSRRPRADGRSYYEQVQYVVDRPGHDKRYAIDASRIRRELGWEPCETFETGLAKTVDWYLENESWWQDLIRERAASVRRGLT